MFTGVNICQLFLVQLCLLENADVLFHVVSQREDVVLIKNVVIAQLEVFFSERVLFEQLYAL